MVSIATKSFTAIFELLPNKNRLPRKGQAGVLNKCD